MPNFAHVSSKDNNKINLFANLTQTLNSTKKQSNILLITYLSIPIGVSGHVYHVYVKRMNWLPRALNQLEPFYCSNKSSKSCSAVEIIRKFGEHKKENKCSTDGNKSSWTHQYINSVRDTGMGQVLLLMSGHEPHANFCKRRRF